MSSSIENDLDNIPLSRLRDIENIQIDEVLTTAGGSKEPNFSSNLTLKNVNKKSNAEVWKHFGILYQSEPLRCLRSDKIYCRPCFKDHKFKS